MIPAKLHRGLTELQSINLLIGPDPSPEGEGFTDPPSGTLNGKFERIMCESVNVDFLRPKGGWFIAVSGSRIENGTSAGGLFLFC
jgi:hypothetical protein